MSKTWQTTTLPNGLRIVTTPIPTTQAATVSLFVGVGSRSEPQHLNGITHFLEHMIFKGTKKRPAANMIAEEIEGAGGTLNAYTSKENTCYWQIVPFDRLHIALDVTADMLLHSTLATEEIDRERTVVQQELKRNHDHPAAWASRLIGQAVYGDQPCGWDVGGSIEGVGEMKRPDFMELINGWYIGQNIVLSVAGNVEHEQVLDLAGPLFGEIPSGTIPSYAPYDPLIKGPRLLTESREIDQCSLILGFPSFGRHDSRVPILRILNDILGAGMSSRLFHEVRERRGLAYSVHSSYGYLDDSGMFTISAGVDTDRLFETIQVCLDELRKLKSEKVSQDELNRAKEHTIGRFRLSLETAFSLGQRHGEHILTRGEIETIDSFVKDTRSVTADEINVLAEELFADEKLHCAVVGPDINEKEVGSHLVL
jgi:predicted Zn-dependent peptidase